MAAKKRHHVGRAATPGKIRDRVHRIALLASGRIQDPALQELFLEVEVHPRFGGLVERVRKLRPARDAAARKEQDREIASELLARSFGTSDSYRPARYRRGSS